MLINKEVLEVVKMCNWVTIIILKDIYFHITGAPETQKVFGPFQDVVYYYCRPLLVYSLATCTLSQYALFVASESCKTRLAIWLYRGSRVERLV